MQHSAAYYFHSRDETLELAAALPALHALAKDTAHGSRTLAAAVTALARALGADFLQVQGASTEAAIAAYADDHRVRDYAAQLVSAAAQPNSESG